MLELPFAGTLTGKPHCISLVLLMLNTGTFPFNDRSNPSSKFSRREECDRLDRRSCRSVWTLFSTGDLVTCWPLRFSISDR